RPVRRPPPRPAPPALRPPPARRSRPRPPSAAPAHRSFGSSDPPCWHVTLSPLGRGQGEGRWPRRRARSATLTPALSLEGRGSRCEIYLSHLTTAHSTILTRKKKARAIADVTAIAA